MAPLGGVGGGPLPAPLGGGRGGGTSGGIAATGAYCLAAYMTLSDWALVRRGGGDWSANMFLGRCKLGLSERVLAALSMNPPGLLPRPSKLGFRMTLIPCMPKKIKRVGNSQQMLIKG